MQQKHFLRQGYAPDEVLAMLRHAPPSVELARATENHRVLDPRGLWRVVRATWSMGPEASAPGREVAFVAFDKRFPETPLGILQFRNVVPEIMPRVLWLGVSVGDASGAGSGYMRFISQVPVSEGRHRLCATQRVLEQLRNHLRTDGLPQSLLDAADPAVLAEFARSRRQVFNELRKSGRNDAHQQLALVKRAETLADLTRGLTACQLLVANDFIAQF